MYDCAGGSWELPALFFVVSLAVLPPSPDSFPRIMQSEVYIGTI